jgi:hypothetical protein
MNRIPFLIITAAMLCQAFTFQTKEVNREEEKSIAEKDSSDKMFIVVGKDALRIEEQDSSLSLRVGSNGLRILESLEGKQKVKFEDYESRSDRRYNSDRNFNSNRDRNDGSYIVRNYSRRYNQDEDYDDGRYSSGARSFRGHVSGLEIGFNNYNYVNSMKLPDDISYMTPDQSHSVNFNVIVSQVNIGFHRHIGIVSGIGLNWNNYRFENRNSITEGSGGIINELIPDNTVAVKRSKFSALYLNAPVLLEFQIPAGYNYLNVGAGVVGGLRLNAWTKVVYEDGEKSRTNGDYNLNLLRGGVTARIGYQNFMLYGTYYLTPWFQELKGPDGFNLEPFEIGLAFTFND